MDEDGPPAKRLRIDQNVFTPSFSSELRLPSFGQQSSRLSLGKLPPAECYLREKSEYRKHLRLTERSFLRLCADGEMDYLSARREQLSSKYSTTNLVTLFGCNYVLPTLHKSLDRLFDLARSAIKNVFLGEKQHLDRGFGAVGFGSNDRLSYRQHHSECNEFLDALQWFIIFAAPKLPPDVQETVTSKLETQIRQLLVSIGPLLLSTHRKRIMCDYFYFCLDVRWRAIEILIAATQTKSTKGARGVSNIGANANFEIAVTEIQNVVDELVVLFGIHPDVIGVKLPELGKVAAQDASPVLEMWGMILAMTLSVPQLPPFWSLVNASLLPILGDRELHGMLRWLRDELKIPQKAADYLWELLFQLMPVCVLLQRGPPAENWSLVCALIKALPLEDEHGRPTLTVRGSLRTSLLRVKALSSLWAEGSRDLIRALWAYFKKSKTASSSLSPVQITSTSLLQPTTTTGPVRADVDPQYSVFLDIFNTHLVNLCNPVIGGEATLKTQGTSQEPGKVAANVFAFASSLVTPQLPANGIVPSFTGPKALTHAGLHNTLRLLLSLAQIAPLTQRRSLSARVFSLVDFDGSDNPGRTLYIQGLFALADVYLKKDSSDRDSIGLVYSQISQRIDSLVNMYASLQGETQKLSNPVGERLDPSALTDIEELIVTVLRLIKAQWADDYSGVLPELISDGVGKLLDMKVSERTRIAVVDTITTLLVTRRSSPFYHHHFGSKHPTYPLPFTQKQVQQAQSNGDSGGDLGKFAEKVEIPEEFRDSFDDDELMGMMDELEADVGTQRPATTHATTIRVDEQVVKRLHSVVHEKLIRLIKNYAITNNTQASVGKKNSKPPSTQAPSMPGPSNQNRELFLACVECLSEISVGLVDYGIATWGQCLEALDPATASFAATKQSPAYRLLQLHFVARLADACPPATTIPEARAVAVWLSSTIDANITNQHLLTAKLLKGSELKYFLGTHPTDSDVLLSAATFEKERLNILQRFFCGVRQTWEDANMESRRKLTSYFEFVPSTLSRCCQEVLGQPECAAYTSFACSVLTDLFLYCSRVLYRKNENRSMLPLLASLYMTACTPPTVGKAGEMVSKVYMVEAGAQLYKVLWGVWSLDLPKDLYLLRVVDDLFQVFLENSSGKDSAKWVAQALQDPASHRRRAKDEGTQKQLDVEVPSVITPSFVSHLRHFILNNWVRLYLTMGKTHRAFPHMVERVCLLLNFVLGRTLRAANSPNQTEEEKNRLVGLFEADWMVVSVPLLDALSVCRADQASGNTKVRIYTFLAQIFDLYRCMGGACTPAQFGSTWKEFVSLLVVECMEDAKVISKQHINGVKSMIVPSSDDRERRRYALTQALRLPGPFYQSHFLPNKRVAQVASQVTVDSSTSRPGHSQLQLNVYRTLISLWKTNRLAQETILIHLPDLHSIAFPPSLPGARSVIVVPHYRVFLQALAGDGAELAKEYMSQLTPVSEGSEGSVGGGKGGGGGEGWWGVHANG